MFEWDIYLWQSAGVFLIGLLLSVFSVRRRSGTNNGIHVWHILFVSSFIALTILFFPIFLEKNHEREAGSLVALLVAIQSTLQVFSINADFSIISEALSGKTEISAFIYSGLASFLYVLAPILTFGFILSFFRNLSSYRKYLFCFFKETYVFSELNEVSLALAIGIRKDTNRCTIVFAGLSAGKDGEDNSLKERAFALDAVFFNQDMLNTRFSLHSSRVPIRFVVTGEDESENINRALSLVQRYRNRSDTHVYVFSSEPGSELLLSGLTGEVKIRRIDKVRSCVYATMDQVGSRLFDDAFSPAVSDLAAASQDREICILLLGLGKMGGEMLKTLAWYTQMDGYKTTIHVFDRDPLAHSRIKAECPELFNEAHNGVDIPGETRMDVRFFPDVDVRADSFYTKINGIDHPTFVFVALGDDEENISAALQTKIYMKRRGLDPFVLTFVQSHEKYRALIEYGVDVSQGISFAGDWDLLTRMDMVFGSDLENKALERHLKWGDEDSFWAVEYNYRSSVASVLHKKARKHCGFAAAVKASEDLTEEERLENRVLEHRRWNAYVRSQGWVFGGSTDKSSRNNAAKMHNLLVPFDDLPEDEKCKDDD